MYIHIIHIIYTYSAYVTHGNGTCSRGNGGGGDGGCNGKNSMFYIISRRIHCIFFVFIYVLNRIREPYEYTHPLHMFALYPFFLDRVKMTERSILFTRRVQMCLWTNEMRLFTSTVFTMQIYRHGRGHTYAHAICDSQNMTTTFILATLCVPFVLIFLRNGCGWFDSHLLLSVDNIPATGYNGSVILGKLQLLRIIRAAILIATFYSYTKRCDAHTQQKNGR